MQRTISEVLDSLLVRAGMSRQDVENGATVAELHRKLVALREPPKALQDEREGAVRFARPQVRLGS